MLWSRPGSLIARVSDVRDARSVAVFIVSLALFVVVCEHLLPLLIVAARSGSGARRDAAGVHAAGARLRPLTVALIDIIDVRRDRETPETRRRRTRRTSPTAADARYRTDRAARRREGVISEEEGRELLQSIVDFTETVVREV